MTVYGATPPVITTLKFVDPPVLMVVVPDKTDDVGAGNIVKFNICVTKLVVVPVYVPDEVYVCPLFAHV